MNIDEIKGLSPAEVRRIIREGRWNKPTSGLCHGFAQANLVILPERYAFDFLLFCQRNPKPCPLLEVLEKGVFEPKEMAPGKGPLSKKSRKSLRIGLRIWSRSSWAAVTPSNSP
jgi:uncharacterized protein YcsI (UPF0317 family)